jgi:hypothetical protein
MSFIDHDNNNKIIQFKDVQITYDELEEYFKEMKNNRNDRDRILEEIAFFHQDIFVKYAKNKPPIDDVSLNTFQFKPLTDIKSDICYSNITSNVNYSCNNALFHLLNNISIKKKEQNLISRIEDLEFKSKIYTYMNMFLVVVIFTYRFL